MDLFIIAVIMVGVIGLGLMFWLLYSINKDFKREQLLLDALMMIVQKNQ